MLFVEIADLDSRVLDDTITIKVKPVGVFVVGLDIELRSFIYECSLILLLYVYMHTRPNNN